MAGFKTGDANVWHAWTSPEMSVGAARGEEETGATQNRAANSQRRFGKMASIVAG